jgi:hypothetical protein
MNRLKNLLNATSNRQSRMNGTRVSNVERCFREPLNRIVIAICAISVLATTSMAQSKILPETLRELAKARRATAKYHDVSRALQDGYVDIHLFVPGQGFHFLNPQLKDDPKFQIDKPEILVYAPGPKGGLHLVAVEYAVRTDQSPDAPEGFTGDDDVWHVEQAFGLWVLHAWIWLDNPDGVFANNNPLVE